MIIIEKPSESTLQDLIDLGAVGTTEADWVVRLLDAIRAQLRKNPVRYREYGPYWWLLKRMFIDRGFLDFGEYVDVFWHRNMDYGQDGFNLAAAFLYADVRFSSTTITDPHHQLNDEITGEPVDFVSNDEDMEIRGQ